MSGGVPYSVLRATQFHSLVDGLISTAARMPLVIPLPTAFMVQSVATSEVADRLVQALVDGPGGRLRDLGGPEVMTLGEAAAVWKDVTRVTKPRRVSAASWQDGRRVPGWKEHRTGRSAGHDTLARLADSRPA